MLVISRQKNENIVIDNDIVLTVVEIRGDKVRAWGRLPRRNSCPPQEVFDAIHGLPHLDFPPRSPEERPFLQASWRNHRTRGFAWSSRTGWRNGGDPLGEFLRNLCRLLKLPPHDENVWELEGRQAALVGRARGGLEGHAARRPVVPFQGGFSAGPTA